MFPKTCFTFGGDNHLNPSAPARIALVQDSKHQYTVFFDEHTYPALFYSEAAYQLGAALIDDATSSEGSLARELGL